MTANQVSLLALVSLSLFSLLLHVMCIKLGLTWARIVQISFLKAAGLLFVFMLASVIVAVCVFGVYFATGIPESETAIDCLAYVIQFATPCLAITWIYKTRLWRAAVAAAPFLLFNVLSFLFATLVIRKYAYEAFSIPTNAMAPTLLGEHWEAVCPRCAEPAYGSPLDTADGRPMPMRMPFPPEGVPMVCSNEMTSVYVQKEPEKRGHGDRVLVCKLLNPRRWDLMVFRYPGDPSVNYVKRLVALPGEKLEIRDGAVWIDGERLTPPESIRGIRYSPTIETQGRVYSGPGSVPLTLGPDEYFVLGDFVDASADSRMWERGAPGHPPYAVPESYIVGVVINIYWPPSRWTSFR